MTETDQVVKYSLNRIKKTINNYILEHFKKQINCIISIGEISSNSSLIKKAADELKYCVDKKATPVSLIDSCI